MYRIEGDVRSTDAKYRAVARAVRGLSEKGLVSTCRAMVGHRLVTWVMCPKLPDFFSDGTLKQTVFSAGTLVEGDCLDAFARIGDCAAAMVYLDPPYNLQLDPSRPRKVGPGKCRRGPVAEWDTFESLEAYDAAMKPILAHALRVLRPEGSLWLTGSYHCVHRLATHLQDMGAWIFTEVAWWRPDATPAPAFNKHPQLLETVLWVAKDRRGWTLVRKRYDDDLMVRYAMEAFQRHQPLPIWQIPACRGKERLRDPDGVATHPTQKPEELLARMVQLSTREGELVLDPMAGTGTTGVVAQELGRKFLLVERKPEYVAAAAKRLASSEKALEAEAEKRAADREQVSDAVADAREDRNIPNMSRGPVPTPMDSNGTNRAMQKALGRRFVKVERDLDYLLATARELSDCEKVLDAYEDGLGAEWEEWMASLTDLYVNG